MRIIDEPGTDMASTLHLSKNVDCRFFMNQMQPEEVADPPAVSTIRRSTREPRLTDQSKARAKGRQTKAKAAKGSVTTSPTRPSLALTCIDVWQELAQ